MRYLSISCPTPAKGQSDFGPKQVVPNQALSLQEILERFTRGEAVSVGKPYSYDEDVDVDLEKVKNLDLVDREEYIESLKKTQTTFERQEKAREKKKRDKLEAELAEKIERDLKAKMATEKGAQDK